MIHSRHDYKNVQEVEAAWNEWDAVSNALIDERFTADADRLAAEESAAWKHYADVEYRNRTPRRQQVLMAKGKGGRLQ